MIDFITSITWSEWILLYLVYSSWKCNRQFEWIHANLYHMYMDLCARGEVPESEHRENYKEQGIKPRWRL